MQSHKEIFKNYIKNLGTACSEECACLTWAEPVHNFAQRPCVPEQLIGIPVIIENKLFHRLFISIVSLKSDN
jgi:hypothetical protein